MTKPKKAGVSEECLAGAYKNSIHPAAEYAVAFNAAHCRTGSNNLITTNPGTKKYLWPWFKCANTKLRQKANYPIEGVQETCKKFAIKNLTNPRCSGWLVS